MYFEHVYILLIVLWWKTPLNIRMWSTIVAKVKLFRKAIYVFYHMRIQVFVYIDYLITEIRHCFTKTYKERDGGGGV